jgi:hypothetical protein
MPLASAARHSLVSWLAKATPFTLSYADKW